MNASTPSAAQGRYVVAFFDKSNESVVSFMLGPYDSLEDAQAARGLAKLKLDNDQRRSVIERLRSLQESLV